MVHVRRDVQHLFGAVSSRTAEPMTGTGASVIYSSDCSHLGWCSSKRGSKQPHAPGLSDAALAAVCEWEAFLNQNYAVKIICISKSAAILDKNGITYGG